MICPSAMPIVGKHLFDNPDGVSPYMVPRSQDPSMAGEKTLAYFNNVAKSMPDSAFVEATGNAGDVYLLHPLMLHSASNNKLRNLRIITNPPVSLNEPFRFDRENSDDYSLVEKKTIDVLGEASLSGWKITSTRDKIVPARLRAQAKMKEEELKRLEELRKGQPEVSVQG